MRKKVWNKPVVKSLNINETKGGATQKAENKPGTQGPS